MKHQLTSELSELHLRLPKLLTEFHVPGVSYAVYEKQTIYPFSAGVSGAKKDHKVDQDTLFHACSMSKLVTSLIVLKLVEQGVLDLDVPVNEYLKNWKLSLNETLISQYNESDVQDVTLIHLLNHSSGILDHGDAFGPLGPHDSVPSILSILTGMSSYNPQPIQVNTQIGSAFSYSDAGFCVIEKLLCDVTGKTFNELAHVLIFDPLALPLSTFRYANEFNQKQSSTCADDDFSNIACGHNQAGEIISQQRATYPYLASAGLWTTAKELSQLLLSVAQAIKGEGALGIPPHLMARMINPEGAEDWAGLGVFVQQEDEITHIFSMGWGLGFQCKLVSNLTQGYGIVVLTNSDPGCDQNSALSGKLISELKEILMTSS